MRIPFFRALCLMVMACCSPAPVLAAATHADHGASAVPKKMRVELGSSAAFSPDGSLYAVSKQGEQVVLRRSADDGVSWSLPVAVNAQAEAISADGENRPKLAFARDGGLLVSWTRPLSKPNTGEIRLARSDDGEHFSAPITVHQDRAEITHRFESMLVAADGRVLLAWIDKRDLEKAKNEAKTEAKAGKEAYRGAAIYAALSNDNGRSFQPEKKLADHSCECCRLASASDADGTPLVMWRHVFAPNERDHAIVRVKPDGSPEVLQRATFDRWKIDGCPHHGPSLAVDGEGVRHAVWFNQKDGEGRVFYGRLGATPDAGALIGQRPVGSPRAEHADLVVAGRRVALVWKEFDGERTRLFVDLSDDAGRTFKSLELAASSGASDQPRALLRGDVRYVFWNSEREGMRVFRLD